MGNTQSLGNPERRAGMDGGLQSLGAETDSWMYKGGKLAGEIAGTAGAGGVLARGASAVPGVAAAAPNLLNAIRTSGMTAGTGNSLANFATRAAGGAVTGGASAGLVNPEDAGVGAAIGGAAPAVLKAAGMAGGSVNRLLTGPAQPADTVQAVKAARELGYVIPPTQAKPTLTNRLLEGFAGKLTTAQNASAKNASVTDGLAAKALGLAPDVKITPDVLNSVRKTAGQAYENIRGAGTVSTDAAFDKSVTDIAAKYKTAVPSFPGLGKTNMHGGAVDEIADLVKAMQTSKQFDASETIDAIGLLRESADKAFRGGDKTLGKANKAASDALEDLLGRHVSTLGNGPMLDSFQKARQLIAKTYTVEKAYNATTGGVDAKKLGAMLQKGKPLTDELREAGDFANRFPKAAQTVEKMGSLPQSSPLDWAVSGGVSAATANPLMLAGVLARPAARGLALSGLVQNRLAAPAANNRLADLLRSPELQQMLLRAAPVAGSR
jgi:hypothetical protein